jgi:hypothetical protein
LPYNNLLIYSEDEFEDAKRVIRQRYGQEKRDKQRYTKHYTKSLRLRNRSPLKQGANSGAPEGYVVAAPPVAPVMLLYITSYCQKAPSYVHI